MGEAGFARFTLEEIQQRYGESTPRRGDQTITSDAQLH
jgi:hypothetical protein